MATVGWLDLQDEYDIEIRGFTIAKSYSDLVRAPSLSGTFSLTSTKKKEKTMEEVNPRMIFWDSIFNNGMEADHASRILLATTALTSY